MAAGLGRSSPIAGLNALAALVALTLLAALGLTGCAAKADPGALDPAGPVDSADRSALAQLAEIATRDAVLDGTPGEVECWVPSAHPLDEGGFRVLCRVHYEQAGTARHRDVICIGDLTADPVSEYCYQWAPYSEMPSFEDHPAVAAG